MTKPYCFVRTRDWVEATQWVIDNAHPGAINVEGWQRSLDKYREDYPERYNPDALRTFHFGPILDRDQQIIFKLMFANR